MEHQEEQKEDSDSHMEDVTSGAAAASSSSSSTTRAKRPADESTADAQADQPAAKRGPPRHFHAGPTQLQSQPQQKAVELHRHALQSIFEFLERRHFAKITHICQLWLDIAVKMPCRGWRLFCYNEPEVYRLLLSPLRRHVIDLRDRTRDGDFPILSLSQASLWMIAERMPHLTKLECHLDIGSLRVLPRWPASLTDLTLHLTTIGLLRRFYNQRSSALAESLRDCAPNITKLQVECSDGTGVAERIPVGFFTPLLQWPQLKVLHLHSKAYYGSDPASGHESFKIIRQLPFLTDIRCASNDDLIYFLDAGGPMPPLEKVAILRAEVRIDKAETVPLLLQLTSLREIAVSFLLSDATPLIPMLSRLRTLTIATNLLIADNDLLVAALQSCSVMTSLHIRQTTFTERHLAAILPSMPLLREFAFSGGTLDSLAFLTQSAHLHGQLEDLRLYDCHLPLEHLRFLKPLRALRSLTLQDCFVAPLDAYSLKQMTPQSECFAAETWPNLQNLDYIDTVHGEGSSDESDEE